MSCLEHDSENRVLDERKIVSDIDSETKKANFAYVRELMQEPLLEREEELALALAWKNDRDQKALHQLTRAYARLVISMALRFRHYGLSFHDLIQEGTLGLMIAAERFDPYREVRFSTYAKWWIRSSMQDFVLRNWSIVRTGTTSAQKQLFFNLRRLRSQLEQVNGESITPEDRETISTLLSVTVKDVEEMEQRLSSHDLSLSAPVTEQNEENWLDFLPDTSHNPEEVLFALSEAQTREHWIKKAICFLTPREKMIIKARRLSESPPTLEGLGKKMKISKERVRQLEARAIRKLRYHLLQNMQDARELFKD